MAGPPAFSGACRILVLDVDGTFLSPDKQPTAAVCRAVAAARDAGVAVCFATGRMFEAIAGWVDELGLAAPQICNNGADVIDPRTRRRLLNCCLGQATVRWLLDQGEARGFVPVLFAGRRILATARTPDDALLERNNEIVEAVPPTVLAAPELRVEKLLYLSIARASELPAVRDALAAAAAPRHDLRFTAQISEAGILNFGAPEAAKLNAVGWVARHLGCSLADVVAVGDGDNDAEVIGGVGLGIAMGNASPAAKAAARRTVPANDRDGLAVAIHQCVLPAAPENVMSQWSL